MNYRYIALIGDLKNSRGIENRNEIQLLLSDALDYINEEYRDEIASNFIITLGDEFQGLLKVSTSLMTIIYNIEKRLYPIKIRFGIGIGEIYTQINRKMAIGADGPAYYNARKALIYIKANEGKNRSSSEYIRAEADYTEDIKLRQLNIIFSMMSVIKNSWTERQRIVVNNMIQGKSSQVSVAKKMGITQSSFQKSISSADYYSYKQAFDEIGLSLEDIRRTYVQ